MVFTLNGGYTRLHGKTLTRLIRLACGIAFILFGYEQGVMGGVITGSAFTKQFPSINTTTANGNAKLQGAVLGMYNIGSWAGSLLTAVLGERLGRKRSIILGCFVIAIGTALQCSSFTLAQLIVGRFSTSSPHPVDQAGWSIGHGTGKWIHHVQHSRVACRALQSEEQRHANHY